jgi:glycosyltransferase involved in cell wall biosynthesis
VPGWSIYQGGQHRRYTYEYNWLFLSRLLRLSRQGAFDLLRIHSPTLGPLGGAYKRLSGRPTVAHYHHLEADKRVQMAISRWVLGQYDLVTTDSEFCVRQLTTTFGLPRQKIVIAYPGVDGKYQPQPRNPLLQERWALTDKTVLLYMGVLTPRKNLRFLLDVFHRAWQQHPQLALLVVGDGPQRAELHHYAQELGIAEAVRFTGYIDEAAKVDVYNLADIFVFPSLLEGFGMAVAEAMACGVPVVSSNAASLPEVVGPAGLVAAPTDLPAFVDQITRLAADASLRHEIGEQGHQYVREHFSWQKSAHVTLDAYLEVVG